MLRELRISNFAIIDELSLAFAPGFNVLTGETGAGKSILMQAIHLLCGGKASPDWIRADAEEARVEGLFAVDFETREWLAAQGLPCEEEIVVQRLISRSGRNRAAVSGALATLSMLQRLGDRLVHIYGQHEHVELLRPETQLQLLDAFGGHEGAAAEMAVRFEALRQAKADLEAALRSQAAARERAEELQGQVEELRAARLSAGEEEELRREREILVHSRRLQEVCVQGEELLYSGQEAISSRLAKLASRVREAARIDPALAEPADLLASAQSQIEEAARALRVYGERLSFDPGQLEAVEDRLALVGSLKRKHNRGSLESLLALKAALEAELAQLERGLADPESRRRHFEECAAAAWAQARELSARRRDAARRMEKQMAKELRTLGMPEEAFSVRLFPAEPRQEEPSGGKGDPLAGLTRAGADAVEFYLAPNTGEPAKPLARIASGGELARVFLALKVLTAGAGDVPTLVFDEVDAGIGGRVAEAVGLRLQLLGKTRQVLCVTHLPQIAARADHHFAVEKGTSHGRTVSRARLLGLDERIAELTRMFGTADPSEAERFARRLVGARFRGGTPASRSSKRSRAGR